MSVVFERFTKQARVVVIFAQLEAGKLRHDYIGTEHLLLGLLREEEGVAARVLESLDITAEAVRSEIVRIVGSGEDVTSGEFPFTPRAKKVLELSLREALSLGNDYIGAEHILLGLVREYGGVAARILEDHGIRSEKIREETTRVLGKGPGHFSGRASVSESGQGLERLALPDLLEGADSPLWALRPEIAQRLGRSPDAGDLLVLLACLPGGLAARTLGALGVDADALAAAAEDARLAGERSALLPPAELVAEIERVRAEKEAAIEAQEFERAAQVRDRERELTKQARRTVAGPEQEVLAAVRALLGLGEP